jgi:hypothetical protein
MRGRLRADVLSARSLLRCASFFPPTLAQMQPRWSQGFKSRRHARLGDRFVRPEPGGRHRAIARTRAHHRCPSRRLQVASGIASFGCGRSPALGARQGGGPVSHLGDGSRLRPAGGEPRWAPGAPGELENLLGPFNGGPPTGFRALPPSRRRAHAERAVAGFDACRSGDRRAASVEQQLRPCDARRPSRAHARASARGEREWS